MANTKISALTAASSTDGTEVVPIVQSTTTKKLAISKIKDYLLATANVFTKAQTFQPNSDAQAGTFRRYSSSQTAKIIEVQTEANVVLLSIDKNGVIAAPNLANGRTVARFTPLDNQPPATNFATLDTRNSIATLDFDDSTAESAVFVGVLPESATTSSGIMVRLFWAATTATSGNCKWGVSFEKFGTDIDADSFDTEVTAYTACSGTSGIVVVTEITATTIDSLAAGDQFRLKVRRVADDATYDTLVGDAELIAVAVRQVA